MPRMRRDVGLDRLGEREERFGALIGVAQQKFVIRVAQISGLEQHGGRVGTAKNVEGGETVRVRPKLNPSRGLVDQA